MIHYLWWVPGVIGLYTLLGWLSVKSNVSNSKVIFAGLIIAQMIPVWALVTKVSKSLLFDALLYDVIAAIACAIAIGVFSGTFADFTSRNWVGIFLVILGLILIKI